MHRAGYWRGALPTQTVGAKWKRQIVAPVVGTGEDDQTFRLENLLPSAGAGPDSDYARSLLIEELDTRSPS